MSAAASGSRITNDRYSGNCRRYFPEQLEPFCADPKFKLGEASSVTAWSGQTCNQTTTDRIGHSDKHNRYCPTGTL